MTEDSERNPVEHYGTILSGRTVRIYNKYSSHALACIRASTAGFTVVPVTRVNALSAWRLRLHSADGDMPFYTIRLAESPNFAITMQKSDSEWSQWLFHLIVRLIQP
jgi:hypothetical protein